jgi:hypothetical protein
MFFIRDKSCNKWIIIAASYTWCQAQQIIKGRGARTSFMAHPYTYTMSNAAVPWRLCHIRFWWEMLCMDFFPYCSVLLLHLTNVWWKVFLEQFLIIQLHETIFAFTDPKVPLLHAQILPLGPTMSWFNSVHLSQHSFLSRSLRSFWSIFFNPVWPTIFNFFPTVMPF